METTAFLGKAAESLASAEDDLAHERYNSCARNAYYSAFQAAVAALLAENIRPRGRWEHEFVRAEFGGRLVYRRKLYASEFRTLLHQAFNKRADADYTDKSLKHADVAGQIAKVRHLVDSVRERIDGNR